MSLRRRKGGGKRIRSRATKEERVETTREIVEKLRMLDGPEVDAFALRTHRALDGEDWHEARMELASMTGHFNNPKIDLGLRLNMALLEELEDAKADGKFTKEEKEKVDKVKRGVDSIQKTLLDEYYEGSPAGVGIRRMRGEEVLGKKGTPSETPAKKERKSKLPDTTIDEFSGKRRRLTGEEKTARSILGIERFMGAMGHDPNNELFKTMPNGDTLRFVRFEDHPNDAKKLAKELEDEGSTVKVWKYGGSYAVYATDPIVKVKQALSARTHTGGTWAPSLKQRTKEANEAFDLLMKWAKQGPQYELEGDRDWNGIRNEVIAQNEYEELRATIYYSDERPNVIKVDVRSRLKDNVIPEQARKSGYKSPWRGGSLWFHTDEPEEEKKAGRHWKLQEMIGTKPNLDNEFEIFYKLVRLEGASGVTRIEKETAKTVTVRVHDQAYRLDKKKLAEEKEFRDSWYFDLYNPSEHDKKLEADVYWQD